MLRVCLLLVLLLPMPGHAQGLPAGLENGVIRDGKHEVAYPNLPRPEGLLRDIEAAAHRVIDRVEGVALKEAAWHGAITTLAVASFILGCVAFHVYLRKKD